MTITDIKLRKLSVAMEHPMPGVGHFADSRSVGNLPLATV